MPERRPNLKEAQKFLDQVPMKSRLLVDKAMLGTASPRAAIKAHCLTCTHFDREAIAECSVWRCPLHAYRPYQKGEEA